MVDILQHLVHNQIRDGLVPLHDSKTQRCCVKIKWKFFRGYLTFALLRCRNCGSGELEKKLTMEEVPRSGMFYQIN